MKKFTKGEILDFMIDIENVCMKHGLFISSEYDNTCLRNKHGDVVCSYFGTSSDGTASATREIGSDLDSFSTKILTDDTKTYVMSHKSCPYRKECTLPETGICYITKTNKCYVTETIDEIINEVQVRT